MLLGSQKVPLLLNKQISKFLNMPMSQRIMPLIGFFAYMLLVPQLLLRIIPFKLCSNNYLSQETSQTILYIACICLGNLLTYILYSIFIYFVYTRKVDLEKYRININKPWPWEQNQQSWKILLRKTIITLAINMNFALIISLTVWAFVFSREVIVSEQMPSYFTIFWQLMLFMVIEDCSSTFTHTLFHSPQLYWIHKKHHEYSAPISIAAQYAHPIDFIFSNAIPTVIGFKVLAYFYPVHIVSAITWLIFRILLTGDVHSGYQFPWEFHKLLPFTAPPSYHDYHHSHNRGNYASSFMLVEAIIGNNHQFYQHTESKNKNIQSISDKDIQKVEQKQ